jgi:hypothetical protein
MYVHDWLGWTQDMIDRRRGVVFEHIDDVRLIEKIERLRYKVELLLTYYFPRYMDRCLNQSFPDPS